jgi:hypothetical protein
LSGVVKWIDDWILTTPIEGKFVDFQLIMWWLEYTFVKLSNIDSSFENALVYWRDMAEFSKRIEGFAEGPQDTRSFLQR